MIAAKRIAAVMGVDRKVKTIRDLSLLIDKGLSRRALGLVVRHVVRTAGEARALRARIVPEATFRRRSSGLRPNEGASVERLARVIATAEFVWDDKEDARTFLTTPHPLLCSETPVQRALSELGAREVEEILWNLHCRHPARGRPGLSRAVSWKSRDDGRSVA
jgi:putative toxin-antitoxin system antitoxin component (TIGR02293 family)